MSIRILRPGLLTTVQDLGRPGYQRFGVSVGGAMDKLSLRVANHLVGNAESAAALEITLLGPTLHFENAGVIAICGGLWSPKIGESVVPMNRPVWIPAGTTLALGSAVRGARAYLAIAGGIDVPLVMGSRSTYPRANIGGLEGRALQSGDLLPSGSPSDLSQRLIGKLSMENSSAPYQSVPWFAALSPWEDVTTLRAIRGTEFERLDEASQESLFSTAFQVTSDSDRMGYRLSGPTLALAQTAEMISSAVCCGTIQAPPQGQPILLMADCATTGGYPKVAQIASVDLPKAAQLKPGDFFRLREISLAAAHNLYLRQEFDLRWLQTSLRLKFAV